MGSVSIVGIPASRNAILICCTRLSIAQSLALAHERAVHIPARSFVEMYARKSAKSLFLMLTGLFRVVIKWPLSRVGRIKILAQSSVRRLSRRRLHTAITLSLSPAMLMWIMSIMSADVSAILCYHVGTTVSVVAQTALSAHLKAEKSIMNAFKGVDGHTPHAPMVAIPYVTGRTLVLLALHLVMFNVATPDAPGDVLSHALLVQFLSVYLHVHTALVPCLVPRLAIIFRAHCGVRGIYSVATNAHPCVAKYAPLSDSARLVDPTISKTLRWTLS